MAEKESPLKSMLMGLLITVLGGVAVVYFEHFVYDKIEKEQVKVKALRIDSLFGKGKPEPIRQTVTKRHKQSKKIEYNKISVPVTVPIVNESKAKVNLGNSYMLGIDSFKKKDYENALMYFQEAAIKGNTQAKVYLGELYNTGSGTRINYKEGYRWLYEAAQENDAKAQNYIGLMYMQGKYVNRDTLSGIYWLKKAAEQNYAWSQCHLAEQYDEGSSFLKRNRRTAFNLYLKAANQGIDEAQVAVGDRYMKGVEIRADTLEAKKWYLRASKQNNDEAQFAVAEMYYHGYGTPVDIENARIYYHKAAEKGNRRALLAIVLRKL